MNKKEQKVTEDISHKHNNMRNITTLLFGCVICLFWGLYYPYHLHYQEQLQLFLFTPEYWADKWTHPGGVAEYIAEFLTQFFFHPWAGAFTIAILLMIMQRLISQIAENLKAPAIWYPLSFLPPLCIWIYLCDQNALLAMPVSLAFALLVWRGYQLLSSVPRWQILYTILITPLLYWGIGGAFFLFVIGVTIDLCLPNRKLYLGAIVYVGLGISCPLSAQYFTQYPLLSLMTGIDYYRFPLTFPPTMVLAFTAIVFIPWIMKGLPPCKNFRKGLLLETALLLIGGLFGILWASDTKREEVLKYDYLTYMNRWKEIIQIAEKKEPKSPFSVTCLNLALAKTGQLGDRMFHFYQNGTEGLIPQFQRDCTSPLPTAEIFYHLGMINISQRYTFEAMEAIPDLKKSGRTYVRLAETNLINGQYAVAAKYLHALQHTIFYRRWATNAMSYLYNKRKIAEHPEWGQLWKIQQDMEDCLFFDAEIVSMLGRLVQEEKGNYQMAFEYLLAYLLLDKDLERFKKYYPWGKRLNYDHIPRSYQEALIFMRAEENPDFQKLPWTISEEVLDGIKEFTRIYMTREDPEPYLRPKFEKTYWYYLLFRK